MPVEVASTVTDLIVFVKHPELVSGLKVYI
jgi:hypothetical protein